MSPFRYPPEPYLAFTDPDLDSSIVLDAVVHENAMPSGPSEPVPKPKPKKERTERIPLKSQDYPSAENGVSVYCRARKVYGSAARLLKSLGSVRIAVVPVPGAAAAAAAAVDGLASPKAGGMGTCTVALSFDALRAVPSLSMADRVGAAVEEDVRVALGKIVAKLAERGEEEDEDLDTAGGDGLEDAVLVTMYDFQEGSGTGYIEMRTVAYDGTAEQDFEISHAGTRF